MTQFQGYHDLTQHGFEAKGSEEWHGSCPLHESESIVCIVNPSKQWAGCSNDCLPSAILQALGVIAKNPDAQESPPGPCDLQALCVHAHVHDHDLAHLHQDFQYLRDIRKWANLQHRYREAHDIDRIGCLGRDDLLVTEAPKALFIRQESGSWVKHDPRDDANVGRMLRLLKTVYDTIALQLQHVDLDVLRSLETRPYTRNGWMDFHETSDLTGYATITDYSIMKAVQERAMRKVEELERTLESSKIRGVSQQVIYIAEDPAKFPGVRVIQADQMDAHRAKPLLPQREGAVDLEEGKIITPAEYAVYYRTERAPAVHYDPDILDDTSGDTLLIRRLLVGVGDGEPHYPPQLMHAVAFSFAYPASRLFSAFQGASTRGKTTFFDLMSWATKSVAVLDAKILRSRSEFNTLDKELVENHLVVLDEADAAKTEGVIPPGVITRSLATNLTVNEKNKPIVTAPRLGQLMFVSNDSIGIDSSLAGMFERLLFAWDKDLPGILTADLRSALERNVKAHQFALAFLVQHAKLLRSFDNEQAAIEFIQVDPEVKAARDRLWENTQPDLLTLLDDHIEVAETDHIPSADLRALIKDLCKENNINVPDNRTLGDLMRRYGKDVRSRSMTVNGKMLRGWTGVRLRKDPWPVGGSAKRNGHVKRQELCTSR